jgi:outer membrane protein OmpA-like peptidoglycan-associated protein
MKTTRVLAAAIVSLCLTLPAQSAQGWYVSLDGGASAVSDWDHTRTKWTICGPVTTDAVATFNTGWAAFGAAGYSLNRWRIELEGGYRHNGIDSYMKEGWKRLEGNAQASGELNEASLMFNLIYDVPIFDRFSLAVGMGAGADFSQFKLDSGWQHIDEDDRHLAYQGLAGLNFALTEATILFLNYRYINVSDVNFDPAPSLHIEGGDFEKQSASAGLRFALGIPAAPVRATPTTALTPVPLQREFIVFFGFNRWNLTPQALNTIQEAMGAVRDSGSAAIRVVGHADRAGSVAYNKALSVRRAQSVKAALITEGLPAGAISVSGRGESEPQVPTADGVREPQNRRVHISF